MSADIEKDNVLIDSYNLNSQIDALVSRCKKCDMLNAFDIFLDPVEKDVDGVPVLPDDVDDLKTFNLLTDTEVDGNNRVVTLKEARDMCLFKRTYGAIMHVQNLMWSQELSENSSEKDLHLKVIECLKEIPQAEQGGPVYFVILKSLIQSNTVSIVEI